LELKVLQALDLLGLQMAKTYLKSDHFNGGGSMNRLSPCVLCQMSPDLSWPMRYPGIRPDPGGDRSTPVAKVTYQLRKYVGEGTMQYFDHDKILEINSEAIELGLHLRRDELLGGLNNAFVARLRLAADVGGQLLSDLTEMNRVPVIIDDVVPLYRWLRNAA